MPERIRFEGLDASAFQHPQDREATDALKRIVGFDRVVAKFLELGYERILYLTNIASAVKVGDTQYPRLHAMLKESCAILDVPMPEMYITQTPFANALTFGHTMPYVMMFTGLIEILTDDELFVIISHELGHIKCGHVLYNMMASLIGILINTVSQFTLGIGGIVGQGIRVALEEWRRRSELSADRAALLASQDPNLVIMALAKLAGGSQRMKGDFNVEAFKAQAKEYDERGFGDGLDDVYRLLAYLQQGSHPFIVERARAVDVWSQSEDYRAILAGDYAKRSPTAQPNSTGPTKVKIRVG